MTLHEVSLTHARNLSPLFDEAVRREQPVMIVRGGREHGLLVSRDALLRVLAGFVFAVDVLPEEEGGFTLWLRELQLGGYGRTLGEARASLFAAARAYATDYLAQFDFFRHLPEKARQEPYVLRLSLTRDDAELGQMLFPPAGTAAASTASTASTVAGAAQLPSGPPAAANQ